MDTQSEMRSSSPKSLGELREDDEIVVEVSLSVRTVLEALYASMMEKPSPNEAYELVKRALEGGAGSQ